ncbi:MAG TPA: permease-like cell division protein FtsX, partial [Luteimonas sp.]|nr:permease-like cell division protein FtsX [Luteimonas sp.]
MSEANATAKPSSPVGTWVDHHLYSLVASLGRVFRKPWAALLTIAVMALALALPLGLWLVLGNVGKLAGSVERSREISVFLKQDVDAARVAELADELRARGNIGSVVHVTPEQGMASLRADGELAGIIDAIGGDNPLPHVLVVTPGGDELMVASSLQQLPEAELVQHDALWRERLDG